MAQRDYNIPSANGVTFRTDIDQTFKAVATQNSGPLAPSDTYPFMVWADTTAGLLKHRNEKDDDWVEVGTLDEPALGIPSKGFPVGSIYQNKTNTNNPSTYLGFGTWVAESPSPLISEVILTTAGNSIVLDASEMVLGESYRLIFEGSTTALTNVRMFVNGDFTIPNYFFQAISVIGTVVNGGTSLQPSIGVNNEAGTLTISCNIFTYNGLFNWASMSNTRANAAPAIYQITGEKNASITDITALEIRTELGNFGANTRVRLMRDLPTSSNHWRRTA